MTTYIIKHSLLEDDVAKFKDLSAVEMFAKQLHPDFRKELTLQNWVNFEVTLTRKINNIFNFDYSK